MSIHRTGEPLHEEPDKRRNVLGSLTQRGDVDGKDVQAIVEIVAEALLLHQPGEVAVRRRDDADVHLDRARTAEALELLLLQDPQELWLQLERQLAHLVEEERTAVGELEATDLLGDRVGERAALVAEQLALQERRRDRGTVHRLHLREHRAEKSAVAADLSEGCSVRISLSR